MSSQMARIGAFFSDPAVSPGASPRGGHTVCVVLRRGQKDREIDEPRRGAVSPSNRTGDSRGRLRGASSNCLHAEFPFADGVKKEQSSPARCPHDNALAGIPGVVHPQGRKADAFEHILGDGQPGLDAFDDG